MRQSLRLLAFVGRQTEISAGSLNAAANEAVGAPLNKRIFVGRLEWITGPKQIRDYFSQFGIVRSVRLNYNRMTGLSKGFAHVTFADPKVAETVLADNNHLIDGRRVTVNRADPNFRLSRNVADHHPAKNVDTLSQKGLL